MSRVTQKELGKLVSGILVTEISLPHGSEILSIERFGKLITLCILEPSDVNEFESRTVFITSGQADEFDPDQLKHIGTHAGIHAFEVLQR